jgi:hypothetical protein
MGFGYLAGEAARMRQSLIDADAPALAPRSREAELRLHRGDAACSPQRHAGALRERFDRATLLGFDARL